MLRSIIGHQLVNAKQTSMKQCNHTLSESKRKRAKTDALDNHHQIFFSNKIPKDLIKFQHNTIRSIKILICFFTSPKLVCRSASKASRSCLKATSSTFLSLALQTIQLLKLQAFSYFIKVSKLRVGLPNISNLQLYLFFS